MSDITLLRIDGVLARRGRSRSQHYREIAEGLAPPPVLRPGCKIATWPAHELDAVSAAEIAGASPDEIRALVRDLVAQRSAGRQPAATATAAA